MLISVDADTVFEKATTGEVNSSRVAGSGAFGAIGDGANAMIGKHLLENVAEGDWPAGDPGGLLRNADEGAATSAASGGGDVEWPLADIGGESPGRCSVSKKPDRSWNHSDRFQARSSRFDCRSRGYPRTELGWRLSERGSKDITRPLFWKNGYNAANFYS